MKSIQKLLTLIIAILITTSVASAEETSRSQDRRKLVADKALGHRDVIGFRIYHTGTGSFPGTVIADPLIPQIKKFLSDREERIKGIYLGGYLLGERTSSTPSDIFGRFYVSRDVPKGDVFELSSKHLRRMSAGITTYEFPIAEIKSVLDLKNPKNQRQLLQSLLNGAEHPTGINHEQAAKIYEKHLDGRVLLGMSVGVSEKSVLSLLRKKIAGTIPVIAGISTGVTISNIASASIEGLPAISASEFKKSVPSELEYFSKEHLQYQSGK